jgi:DNA-binding CsgD family transcriptional regulator
MVHAVNEQDLRTMVDLIDQARGTCPPIGLPSQVLELTQALVACDVVSFLDLEPATHQTHIDQEGTEVPLELSEDYDESDPFWHHYLDCQPCSYPTTSGDEQTITTLSDFYSQRQWHQTGMYADCLAGFEHEAMLCITCPAGRSRRLVLLRSGTRNFDDRDRLILALLRPHLNEAYQELQRRRAPEPALTPAQQRVLRLVADGLSNKEVAHALVVSATTVRTHLENIFATLQVTSRGAAVAKAFPRAPF